MAQRSLRMKRELEMLAKDPPFGISCWPKEESFERLEAQIMGVKETPYEKGIFKLEVVIPERYPFEPPKVTFLTPIYHPNIDDAGRICLDALKMPPKGAWKPSLNISTVLTSIQLLMSEANPDDGLMAEIASEYKYDRSKFNENARLWTQKHAMQDRKLSALKEKNVPQSVDSTQPQTKKSSPSEVESADEEDGSRTPPLVMRKRPATEAGEGKLKRRQQS
eukprot:Colp12_sorted_trinity150504_noHs@36376